MSKAPKISKKKQRIQEIMSRDRCMVGQETCICCKFFTFAHGESAWSEVTPGYDPAMECGKLVWQFNVIDGSWDEGNPTFRQCLLSAVDCEKFEHIRSQLREDESHE